jgi:hypothetical protein
MPTLTVKDAFAVNQVVNTINNNGQGTMANSSPVVLASDQSAVPVSLNSVNGIATVATSATLSGSEVGLLTRNVPATVTRSSFSDTAASLVSPEMVSVGAVGAGIGVSQAGGSLVVTMGTTTSSEFLARTVATVRGAHAARASVVLSQRIANNSVEIGLADSIGDNLSFTNTSATNVDVTIPSNPFTANNIGQFINLSAITTVAGIPGRFAIAAVAGNVVSFTVAGWPGAGSGTLSLWGWNYHRVMWDSTTATQAKYDSQRRGWNSGDTTITTSTSASPGHIVHLQSDGNDASVADSLRASNTAYQFTTRGSRIENLVDASTTLYMWIRVLNGTVAPASTTTLTVGFMSIEDAENIKVAISGGTRNGQGNAIQVASNNLNCNTSQVGGSNMASNNGTATAGAQRMVIASDNTANSNPWLDTLVASAAQGASTTHHAISAATTNATSVKASAGTINTLQISNVNAAARYLKLYNKASAPTVGTDTPVMTIYLPPTSNQTINTGAYGIRFSTGIAYALTTGITVADATAVAASEHSVGIFYT